MSHFSSSVILLSGGPDSTTLAYDLIEQGVDLHALTFDFGEREGSREAHFASETAKGLNIPHVHLDLSSPLAGFYGIPHPQYLRKVIDIGGVVEPFPDVQAFGSAIALLMSASWAVKHGIHDVHYAVHRDDTMYIDNSPEYFQALHRLTALCEGDQHAVRFHTPYLSISKGDVVKKGIAMGIDYSATWSCARGGKKHCGTCTPCADRQVAFNAAGVHDPTEYANVPTALTS